MSTFATCNSGDFVQQSERYYIHHNRVKVSIIRESFLFVFFLHNVHDQNIERLSVESRKLAALHEEAFFRGILGCIWIRTAALYNVLSTHDDAAIQSKLSLQFGHDLTVKYTRNARSRTQIPYEDLHTQKIMSICDKLHTMEYKIPRLILPNLTYLMHPFMAHWHCQQIYHLGEILIQQGKDGTMLNT